MRGLCILFCIPLLTGCGAAAPPRFGIYLTEHPSFIRVQLEPEVTYHDARIDLADVTLMDPPLVSDDDMIEYDWSQHRVTLRRGVGRRSPHPDSFGTPFVVVANGHRCYLGGIWTPVSSVGTLLPIIEVTDVQDDCFEIKLGYPGSVADAVKQDPRDDSRVCEALGGLGELKHPQ